VLGETTSANTAYARSLTVHRKISDFSIGRVGFGEQIAEQRRPDPLPAVLGQERDVDDPDLAPAAVDVEPAGLSSTAMTSKVTPE
jgi:hypothetical protein